MPKFELTAKVNIPLGGGMKIAPEANRNDDILEIYIIKAKSYKKIIPVFPL